MEKESTAFKPISTATAAPAAAPLRALLGCTLAELKAIATGAGLPAFVGSQLAGWLYGKHVRDIAEMSNVSKAARARLGAEFTVGCSEPVERLCSVDGTVKYLYRTAQGGYVETVFIPDGERATLCVSCQVGCKMGCAFCMTGRQGFSGHLSAADILNQIYSLPERERLTNIVFMGQGEPFDNLDNVLRATEVLTADWGFAWSPKRITVSSVGLEKGLVRFLEESRCHLAISLHHPEPAGRAALMPAERAFSIKRIAEVLRQYDFCRKTPGGKDRSASVGEGSKQRRLSFEYIVFRGVNDTLRHAAELVRLLAGLDCRINLIRFHTIPGTPLEGTDEATMLALRDYLTSHGIFTTIRASRGQDIYAACGLLSTARQQDGAPTPSAAPAIP